MHFIAGRQMAYSIDGAGDTGFPQPTAPLPIVGTIELATRTFSKAPFTLLGTALIPIIPALVIGALALLAPQSVHHLLTLVSFIVQYATQFIVMAALVIVTRNLLDDGERGVGAALQAALGRLLPLVGMVLLQFIAIVLGVILFIVPGMIVAIMLFVALPACVLEELGPVASLKRSAQLTKGNRLRLFGLALLVLLSLMVASLVMACALATSSKIVIGIAVLILAVVGFVLVGVALTLPTIVFLQLRQLHEPGVAPMSRV
jgi:hypothetical protein